MRLEPQAALAGDDPRNWLERRLSPPQTWRLDVEVAMPDGRWLRNGQRPTLVPAHWDRVLTFSLLVELLPATASSPCCSGAASCARWPS